MDSALDVHPAAAPLVDGRRHNTYSQEVLAGPDSGSRSSVTAVCMGSILTEGLEEQAEEVSLTTAIGSLKFADNCWGLNCAKHFIQCSDIIGGPLVPSLTLRCHFGRFV
jgi:hypothetical protein